MAWLVRPLCFTRLGLRVVGDSGLRNVYVDGRRERADVLVLRLLELFLSQALPLVAFFATHAPARGKVLTLSTRLRVREDMVFRPSGRSAYQSKLRLLLCLGCFRRLVRSVDVFSAELHFLLHLDDGLRVFFVIVPHSRSFCVDNFGLHCGSRHGRN